MRLPLVPVSNLNTTGSSSSPPLAFIDEEPFIVELQGSLELHGAAPDESQDMSDVVVGKIDLSEPTKPILQIAHHRLEGKLVSLSEPYALLRTTPAPTAPTVPAAPVATQDITSSPLKERGKDKDDEEVTPPKIEIVSLVRRKIVFSKRPEPLVTLSSEL
ncbi:hypothetical protein MNV49_006107 [Pseudohyphozyma bogoriensis]|nr:hypothetical protein MNV49_006107 [Pseudohyphozyma bogoriensis]